MNEPPDVHQAADRLYRGTTRGWPGNAGLPRVRPVSTSTDPFVAVLFAVECKRYGEAIMEVIPRERVQGFMVAPNWFAEVECETALDLGADQLHALTDWTLGVEVAAGILRHMGFPVPQTIGGLRHMHQLLKDTYAAGIRLSADQRATFDRSAWEQRDAP